MIYIQSDNTRSLPHHFDAACAWYGAEELGLDARLTTIEEIRSGKFDLLLRKNTAIGSAEFMTEVFQRIGKNPQLPLLTDRPYECISLGLAREKISNGERFFIKPLKHKLFSGTILSEKNLLSLSRFDAATEVMICEVLPHPIVSEWRIYVQNGKMSDARNYSGDFTVSPDYQIVREKLSKLEHFPCAFVMDIGILADGSNVVIEFNDMWAIGNYGMENSRYLGMLIERYNEILTLQ